MKKVIALCLTMVIIIGGFTSCSGSDNKSVSTDGSTSMEKVINTLGESFKKDNPDIEFTYNPTGSSSGISAVSEGRCDIGLASRDLKDEEIKQGLKSTILAYDGIAMVVNNDNPINDLSLDDINKIYTGKIKNWKELGGNDADIVLIGREAGSGTRSGFEEIAKIKDKCKYKQELTSTGDVIATVSKNPNAIGYASLSSLDEKVKNLSLDGVNISASTVKDGSYKLQRPFVLVTKKDAELSSNAQKFFNYILSSDVEDIILSAGVVPATH